LSASGEGAPKRKRISKSNPGVKSRDDFILDQVRSGLTNDMKGMSDKNTNNADVPFLARKDYTSLRFKLSN